MTLLISRKENVANDLSGLPTAFRQIENWANVVQWQTLPITSLLTNRGGSWQTAQYTPEPDGFICLRGFVQFVSGISAVTPYTIAQMPVPLSPANNEVFSIPLSANGGTSIGTGFLEVFGKSAVNPGTMIVYPSISSASTTYTSFSGIRWTPF